ncbi:hypothetical protein YC2023_052994 [Brassica napus]
MILLIDGPSPDPKLKHTKAHKPWAKETQPFRSKPHKLEALTHEASPPRGHTLRHRRRPRFASTPGANRRELTDGEARHGVPSPPVILTDDGGAKRSLHLAGT